MKKKIVLTCMMMILIAYFCTINIFAYSPHYLPGGKNYLSGDNFHYEITPYYSTLENFLVKPYTEYTLTLHKDYCGDPFTHVEIVLYNNTMEVDSLYITPGDFDTLEGDWFYKTFTTTSDTNYIAITFEDSLEYFVEGSLHQIQLEEGNTFTGFEPYIEGELIDTSAPYFQNSGSVISYYDSPITVSEIQDALTAYDSIDGDVSSSISLISDGYTSNIGVLGVYECIFEVSDTSNNTSQVIVEVELVDVLKPVFSEIETVQSVFPNTYSTNEILAMLSASDNYDGDITNQIVLIEDNYSVNSSLIGTYDMEFEVMDSSGNVQSYIQYIEVIDDEFPVISGINSISIGYDEVITPEQIEAYLECTDNYDSQVSLEIVLDNDTYSSNTKVLGEYEMVFSVTDSSSNKTMQSVIIEVVDEIGPIVYFNSSIIQTYTDTVMELPDFTQLLINTSELDNGVDYFVTVRYDSYTRNSDTPGTYHIQLNLTNDIGEEYSKDLEVRVIERPVDYIHLDGQEIAVDTSFIDEFKSYIMGGVMSILLVVSNVVWVVLFKKKS
jgi:hypothetical protein